MNIIIEQQIIEFSTNRREGKRYMTWFLNASLYIKLEQDNKRVWLEYMVRMLPIFSRIRVKNEKKVFNNFVIPEPASNAVRGY